MRSHGLRQLVDDKSVASCQQACCKLIISTGLLQIVLQRRASIEANALFLHTNCCQSNDVINVLSNANCFGDAI